MLALINTMCGKGVLLFAPSFTTCMVGMGTVIHNYCVWEGENQSLYKLILCGGRYVWERETRLAIIDKMSACVGRENRVLIRCVCVLEGKTKCLHSILLHTYLCGNASNKFNYCEGGETSSR